MKKETEREKENYEIYCKTREQAFSCPNLQEVGSDEKGEYYKCYVCGREMYERYKD